MGSLLRPHLAGQEPPIKEGGRGRHAPQAQHPFTHMRYAPVSAAEQHSSTRHPTIGEMQPNHGRSDSEATKNENAYAARGAPHSISSPCEDATLGTDYCHLGPRTPMDTTHCQPSRLSIALEHTFSLHPRRHLCPSPSIHVHSIHSTATSTIPSLQTILGLVQIGSRHTW